MKTYSILFLFVFIISCGEPESEDKEQTSDVGVFTESEDLYEATYHKLKYELYKQIQEARHNKATRSVIESLILKHSDSLLSQIREFAEKFSEKEFGLSDEIIVSGAYIQKVPSAVRKLTILPSNSPPRQEITDYLKSNFKNSRILEPLIMLNSKLNSRGKFEINKMHPFEEMYSKFVNDNDIYPVMYNLYLADNQPEIYIVGNRIYRYQNQDKVFFIRGC
nr:hypothetical protein LKV13_04720 [Borrelia sp. BU AG58]